MRSRLIKLRKDNGYTQVCISKVLDISRSHYSQIESGDKSPSLRLALRIKKCLNCESDDIFLLDNDANGVIALQKSPETGNTEAAREV